MKTIPGIALTSLAILGGCAATAGNTAHGETASASSGEFMAASTSARPKRRDRKFGTKGAPWTIRLMEIQGTQRVSVAEQLAETLRNTKGIRPQDVFYQNDADGFTRLYYGTYLRQLDSKTGKHSTPPQLAEDLAFIKQLADPSGQRYFFTSIPVRMPQPDVGDPAWNLANVKADYSLQVAAFEPTDEFWQFKEAAVEYVKLLREQGYQAYYHHSPVASVVTVGAFGPEALVKDAHGLTNYSAEIQRLQQDDLLKYNLLNGRIYYVIDKGQKIPVPSSVVKIPKDDAGD